MKQIRWLVTVGLLTIGALMATTVIFAEEPPATSPPPPPPPTHKPAVEPAKTGPPEFKIGPEHEQARERFLIHLKEADPQQYEKLMRLREQKPDAFEREIARRVEEMARITRMREEDPEMFRLVEQVGQLERKAHDLAMQYRNTVDEAAREEIRKELVAVLGEIFGVKQDQRELQVARMTKEVERQRAQIEKREANKAALIEKRLGELTGEAEGLEW